MHNAQNLSEFALDCNVFSTTLTDCNHLLTANINQLQAPFDCKAILLDCEYSNQLQAPFAPWTVNINQLQAPVDHTVRLIGPQT